MTVFAVKVVCKFLIGWVQVVVATAKILTAMQLAPPLS
jgi:hypothetical protein